MKDITYLNGDLKRIAENLIYAQNSSEVAKLRFITQEEHEKHYNIKNHSILKAMKILDKSKTAAEYFRVVVQNRPDEMSYIVYFEYRFNAEKHQISFHMPYHSIRHDDVFTYLDNKVCKSYTRWDKKLGYSRVYCNELKDLLERR